MGSLGHWTQQAFPQGLLTDHQSLPQGSQPSNLSSGEEIRPSFLPLYLLP